MKRVLFATLPLQILALPPICFYGSGCIPLFQNALWGFCDSTYHTSWFGKCIKISNTVDKTFSNDFLKEEEKEEQQNGTEETATESEVEDEQPRFTEAITAQYDKEANGYDVQIYPEI